MNLRQIRLLPLGLLFTMSISPASATTLHYVGPNFFSGDIFDGHVEATVTFSSPLVEGAILSLGDISSFSISSLSPLFGNRTITSEDATFAFAEFSIGPQGLPTDWGFGAELNLESNPNPERITTGGGTTTTIYGQTLSSTGDIFFIDDPQANSPFSLASGGGGATAMQQGPGNCSVVPEPGSLILITLCIFSFSLKGRGLPSLQSLR